MRNYEFVGSCVSNPFKSARQLCRIITSCVTTTKDPFLSSCKIPGQVLDDMKEYPNDYEYYCSALDDKEIYFYVHSRIEYFFVKGEMLCVQQIEESTQEE